MRSELAEAILELDDARLDYNEVRLREPVSSEARVRWLEMLERMRRELRRMALVVDRLREETEA